MQTPHEGETEKSVEEQKWLVPPEVLDAIFSGGASDYLELSSQIADDVILFSKSSLLPHLIQMSVRIKRLKW